MSKGSKMMQYVNWRMRVTLSDTRSLLGTFMAFDKHMNIVLGDCDEYRILKGKKAGEEQEVKRSLGLVLLRGENVVSLTAESPPLPKPKLKTAIAGPGVGAPAGRGMTIAPLASAPHAGLSGPTRGIGGPPQSVMMPQAVTAQAPVSYGRGSAAPGGPPPPQNAGRGMFGAPPMFGGRGGPPMFGGRGGPPMFGGRGGPPPHMMFGGRGGPPPRTQ